MSGSVCNSALNHAAPVVGYGTMEILRYLKIMNSWGPIRGEGSHFRRVRSADRDDLSRPSPLHIWNLGCLSVL